MKGEMALDMVVKFLIVLVVVGVVIGLFLKFSSDSKDAVKDMFKGKNNTVADFPKTEKGVSFSPGEVRNYIESCYNNVMEAPEANRKQVTVCYVLMANSPFSGFVTSSSILGAVDPKIRSNVMINTTFSQPYIEIKFLEFVKEGNGNLVSNRVIVE